MKLCIIFLCITHIIALAQEQVLKNSGFEDQPLGKYWTLKVTEGSGKISFSNESMRSLTGNSLAVLSLNPRASFPRGVRLGQKNLLLEAGLLYRYNVGVRVDEAASLSEGRRSAKVSAFCQRDGDVSIGIDTELNEAPGRFDRKNYRPITFNIVGDGSNDWECWVGVLAQPLSTERGISLSVDQFSIQKIDEQPSPNGVRVNRIINPIFQAPILTPTYDDNGRIQFSNGRGWYMETNDIDTEPAVIGTGSNRRLRLHVKNRANAVAFSGVTQQITLEAGQMYEMCIDYKRVNSQFESPTSAHTTFSYYVRRPRTVTDDGIIQRKSQGVLFGNADVQATEARAGKTSLRFIAPETSNSFEIVLRVDKYKNNAIPGDHVVDFYNAQLVPVSSLAAPGCR